MPKGSRVLMADDDKMLIDMYKERLELAGYIVITAYNGEELLAKVHEAQPDVILLDIMMPKLDGYQALASLKSDAQTKNIPVIMLSALMRDFDREKAVEVGADDYLIKSEAMPSDVIVKIEDVLEKYRSNQKPAAPPETPAAEKKSEQPGMIETHPVGVASKPEIAPMTPELNAAIKPQAPIEPEPKKSNSWIIGIIILLVSVAAALIYFLLIRK